MFDLPARFHQDEKLYAVRIKTRAHFRRVEEQELQSRISRRILRYSEEQEGIPQDLLDPKYIGFVSQSIYDQQGSLVGDTLTARLAALGREKQPRALDDPELGSIAKTSHGFTQQHAVALQAGLEVLPRGVERPVVRTDCETTRRLVSSQRPGSRLLSHRTRQVLGRTNFARDRSLSYLYRGDVWASGRRMLRRRGMQVVATLLWTCLDRGDYERAYTALGVLFRSEGITMRNLWMPAVEIIAWRHSRGLMTQTPTSFLDWLIVNFPTLPSGVSMSRKTPRAEFFRPLAIISRLVSKDYRGALNKAEEATHTIPTSNDPLCWALAGLAALKLQDVTGKNHEKDVQKYFKRCIDLGGVLPRPLQQSQLKHSEDSSDLDNPSVSPSVYSEIQSRSSSDSEAQEDSDMSSLSSRASDPQEFDSSDDEFKPVLTSVPDPDSHVMPSDADAEDRKSGTTNLMPSENVRLDLNEVEDDLREDAPVKQELGARNEDPAWLRQSQQLSQASTLGASWSDSESEDQ